MNQSVTVREVDTVPTDSRVCHYDELDEGAKEQFPALTGDETTAVGRSVANELDRCDLVKYTEYYEVSLE